MFLVIVIIDALLELIHIYNLLDPNISFVKRNKNKNDYFHIRISIKRRLRQLPIREDILDQCYRKVTDPYENDDTILYASNIDINQEYVHDRKDHYDIDRQILLMERDY